MRKCKIKQDNRKQVIIKDLTKAGSLIDKEPYYDPDLRCTIYAKTKRRADSFIALLKERVGF